MEPPLLEQQQRQPEPEPEPEPEAEAPELADDGAFELYEPPPLSEDEFAATVKGLKRAKVICENTYDTIRLDSRQYLEEAVMLALFSQCARDARLAKPAEELMLLTLTTSTPLPVTEEMVGVIVIASAQRGRVHGAMGVVNAAAKGNEYRVPASALGALIQVLVQEEGGDSAHDAYVFYRMMLDSGYDEPLPWDDVSALCCKQLRLAAALSEPLTEITANEAEEERKMWLRRTIGILEEFRRSKIEPPPQIFELLEGPAWVGSGSTTCWNYVVARGWIDRPDGCSSKEWLIGDQREPRENWRLSFDVREDMLVTIRDGEHEVTDDLQELLATEPHPLPSRIRKLLKLLQAKCVELELAVVDVVLEYLLALKAPQPSTNQLGECVHGRKYFMQRHIALQYRLAQEHRKNKSQGDANASLERSVIFIQLRWHKKMKERIRARRVRELEMIKYMQGRFKTHLFFNRIKRKMARRKQHIERKFERLQSALSNDWTRIAKGRRVEVHVPSLSLSEHHRYAGELNIQAREDLQMGRIVSRALDPNIFVILVTRSAPSPEVIAYYDSIISGMVIESGGGAASPGLDGDHRSRRRYHIISAENARRFPDSMALTQMLLYSPNALRQILRIVADRPCYIVPGVVGVHEKQLCAHLGVPLLGNDPNMYPQHCNRISARKLFKSVGVHVAGGTHLAPLLNGDVDEVDEKRVLEFERLKRKAVQRLSSLAIKKKRAFQRLDAALIVQTLAPSEQYGDGVSQTEAEAELLEDIPGVFLSIDLAVEQKYPDIVGLWLTLASTMMNNLHTSDWLLKIADQTEGRGNAAIHCADFQGMRAAIDHERQWGCKLVGGSAARQAVLAFAAELALELPRLARLSRAAQVCYGSFAAYFDELTRKGGVFEETPETASANVIGCSASLLIRPSPPEGTITGEPDWEILHLIERRSVINDDEIHGDGPCVWTFPLGCQDDTPASAGRARRKLAAERTARARRAAVHMLKLCQLVAPELARRGVRGYLSIDAIAFNGAPTPRRAAGGEEGEPAYDGRPLTPVPEVRAATDLWATDICYGYTDRQVSLEVAHAMLQGQYLPGRGIYTIRKGSEQRCMAGCRIISPLVDKILGGRGGGLASFFRWANVSGQRQLLRDARATTTPGDGDDGGGSSPRVAHGPLGCQYDISQQRGGLFSLPPCPNDSVAATAGASVTERGSPSPMRRRNQTRGGTWTEKATRAEVPDVMALTVVSTDSASCWNMLRNTVGWLDETSQIGPARAVASEINAPKSPRAAAPPSELLGTALREEEDNMRHMLGLLHEIA